MSMHRSSHVMDSVWRTHKDPCDESDHVKLRSILMGVLADQISQRGWTQAQAAKRLHVTQPRISDLIRGKAALFSLDCLVKMLHYADLRAEITVHDKDHVHD